MVATVLAAGLLALEGTEPTQTAVHNRTGGGEIFTMSPDGTGVTPLN
jgi:hypothetical protein